MTTRSSRKKKSAAADLFLSPKPELVTTPPTSGKSLSESQEFEFNFDTPKLVSSSSTKRKTVAGDGYASMMKPAGNSSSPSLKSVSTFSDLKELTSSRLESIKRQLERSHSEICKDLEASESRLQKRYKIQNQAIQQVLDEAERAFKKMSDDISEGREAMKASNNEFMAEAQASSARLCKISIPDISKRVEKALDLLRNHYGIPSAPVC